MPKAVTGNNGNGMPHIVSEVVAAPPTPPSQLMVEGKGEWGAAALQSPMTEVWDHLNRAARYSERCAGGTAPTPAPTPMKAKEPIITTPVEDGPDIMEQLASLLNDGNGIGGSSGSPIPECLDGLIIRPEKSLESSKSSKGGNSLLASMLSAVPPTPFSTPARPLGTTPRKPISQSVPSSVSRKMFDDETPEVAAMTQPIVSEAAFSMPPLLPMEDEGLPNNGGSHPITNLSSDYNKHQQMMQPQQQQQQVQPQQVFSYPNQQMSHIHQSPVQQTPSPQQSYVMAQEPLFQAPPPPPPLFSVVHNNSPPQQMPVKHMNGYGIDPPPLLQTAQGPAAGNYDPPPKNLIPNGLPVSVMVEFKMGRRAKYDGPPMIKTITDGTHVIVKGDRGEHLGRLSLTSELEEGESQGILIRTATPTELDHHAHHSEMEAEALETCSKKLHEYGLVMELCYAEYQFDLKKLTFFYRVCFDKKNKKKNISFFYTL